MTRGGRRAALVALLVACACLTPASAADVPVLTGRVVDNAGIIRPDTRARITAVLKAHEEATTNQIAVLTVPTIQPESIEEYAVKVFASWKLGQKGRDNGVLLVVVPQDRKLRIEVGYGLEPVLTDGRCGPDHPQRDHAAVQGGQLRQGDRGGRSRDRRAARGHGNDPGRSRNHDIVAHDGARQPQRARGGVDSDERGLSRLHRRAHGAGA